MHGDSSGWFERRAGCAHKQHINEPMYGERAHALTCHRARQRETSSGIGAMKAAGIRAFGSAVEVLNLPRPTAPGNDQVLIEVLATGAGNWDDFARRGVWNIGVLPPMALGVEAAGVVTAVGPLVSRFAVGDEVLVHSAPVSFQGSWAQQFLAPASDVASKPSAMDWHTAGSFPVPALTAAEVVRSASVRRGEKLLVNGASGVTGGLIVAAASVVGVSVVAVCSLTAVSRARNYGAVTAFDSHDPKWREDARHIAPGGFRAVINASRGQAATLLSLVEEGGTLATITGDPPKSERSINVLDFYLAPDGLALEQAASEFATRGLELPIAATGGLEDAGRFLSVAVGGQAKGAQVLLPNGPVA